MAAYSASYSQQFVSTLKGLDRHQRELVLRRVEKILQNPELGKPLHAPLSNYKSERLESLRIIYKITGDTVEFAWVSHRKDAYD